MTKYACYGLISQFACQFSRQSDKVNSKNLQVGGGGGGVRRRKRKKSLIRQCEQKIYPKSLQMEAGEGKGKRARVSIFRCT